MKSNSRPGSVLAGGGAVAGLAALIGASCCVLPILLVQLGVSTALVAQLGFFADAKPYLLPAAAVLLVVGFVVAFWGGRSRVAAYWRCWWQERYWSSALIVPH